jgi:hypothetical protein
VKEPLMSWGGKRPGAGRPKGAIDHSTLAIVEAAKAGGEMPIEYMLRVMRDPKVWGPRRDKMALAAATYLHLRIANLPADDGEEVSEASAPAAERETTQET